jgi:hypothetical protein
MVDFVGGAPLPGRWTSSGTTGRPVGEVTASRRSRSTTTTSKPSSCGRASWSTTRRRSCTGCPVPSAPSERPDRHADRVMVRQSHQNPQIGCHSAGRPGRRKSSCSALAISAGVSAPCSACQSSTNRARAAARTASPDSGSERMLILPALTSWILGQLGGRLGLLGRSGLATRAGRRGGGWGCWGCSRGRRR